MAANPQMVSAVEMGNVCILDILWRLRQQAVSYEWKYYADDDCKVRKTDLPFTDMWDSINVYLWGKYKQCLLCFIFLLDDKIIFITYMLKTQRTVWGCTFSSSISPQAPNPGASFLTRSPMSHPPSLFLSCSLSQVSQYLLLGIMQQPPNWSPAFDLWCLQLLPRWGSTGGIVNTTFKNLWWPLPAE